MTALTRFPDPQPSIRGIHKELVKYKRDDGVELSFTLYLPPDYKQGTRLPDGGLGLSVRIQRRRYGQPGERLDPSASPK